MLVGWLVLLLAVSGMIWGLYDQARELQRMRAEIESAQRIIAALAEEERRRQQAEERKVIDFLA